MATFTGTAEPEPQVKEYQLGQHYKHGPLGQEYVLAQVDNGRVALISIGQGNRYTTPVFCKDIFDITDAEFYKICGNSVDGFIPVEEFELKRPSEDVCMCKKEMLPKIIPDISVGFRYKGATILCYMQVRGKLRIGVATCSVKDSFNAREGEKIALGRVIDQHKFGGIIRRVLWENYLYTKKIKKEPDQILDFFKSASITFKM